MPNANTIPPDELLRQLTALPAEQRASALAALSGSGAIAQGQNAQAVGAGGVLANNNAGFINTGLFVNVQGGEIEQLLALSQLVNASALLTPALAPDRKREVEQYFNDIAQTLDDSAMELKQRRVPHGKCGEMLGYAHNLPASVADVVGAEQSQVFKAKLIDCYAVESFGARYFGLPQAEMDAEFGKLEEAAGYFRAAAKSLKARA